jgi:hypothetical protein
MTYKRKKYHYGDTHLRKRWRTKRKKKDLDEVSLVVVRHTKLCCTGICILGYVRSKLSVI